MFFGASRIGVEATSEVNGLTMMDRLRGNMMAPPGVAIVRRVLLGHGLHDHYGDADLQALVSDDTTCSPDSSALLLMLRGCGLTQHPTEPEHGLRSSFPEYVQDKLQPGAVLVPTGPSGDLDLVHSLCVVALSDESCLVADVQGRPIGRMSLAEVEDRLDSAGPLFALQLPTAPLHDITQDVQPLYTKPLAKVVPESEEGRNLGIRGAIETEFVTKHRPFANEAAMRRRCHARELDCDIPDIRLFVLQDRDQTPQLGKPHVPQLGLFALHEKPDGSLVPVGGRVHVAINILPEWRGIGLGAALCLAAHDDPVLRHVGTPGNRTIGSHKAWLAAHRMAVEQALDQGLTVPDEVLQSYPDLQPATAALAFR